MAGKMALDHIEKRGSLRDDFKPFYPHSMESFFDFSLEEIEDLDMENEGGTDLLHTEGGDEIPVGKLCIPMDSLNELEEWDFTKDSQLQCLGPEPSKNATGAPILQNFQAPAKARSKGLQSGRRVWSMNAVPFGDASQLQPANHRQAENCEEYAIPQDARRCSHCLSEKTPQWRMGPLGPKTLCNACGVRYKSGRLLPEYRPAASPTFVSSVHSNSHRKVLEIRKKKGTF